MESANDIFQILTIYQSNRTNVEFGFKTWDINRIFA